MGTEEPDREGDMVGWRGGEKEEWGEDRGAPQCWVLMVETPLRLACAGHERDRTKQVLGWEGLGRGGGGGLRSVRFHAGSSLHRLVCVRNVTEGEKLKVQMYRFNHVAPSIQRCISILDI